MKKRLLLFTGLLPALGLTDCGQTTDDSHENVVEQIMPDAFMLLEAITMERTLY